MLLAHLSDLHLGKRLHEYSLLEDQAYILTQILEVLRDRMVDGVILAGDVYDKSIPSADAVQLFDDFLTGLARLEVPVFVISGNHDSPERIAYGARLLNSHRIYLSPVFRGMMEPVVLEDEFGLVAIHLMPFVKPATVRKTYPEEEIHTYNDGVKTVVGRMAIDPTLRNILIAHQFVTGSLRCESEDISVGGVDNVDGATFAPFDYVALGHLHSPQWVGGALARYCGTPLKYSVSEADHQKSMTLIHLGPKGQTTVEEVPYKPLRNLRKIRGTYMELTAKEHYKDTQTDDFIFATLTDEHDVMDALAKLRTIYPNMIGLEYDNTRTRTHQAVGLPTEVDKKTPVDLFDDFFEVQNNQRMDDQQRTFVVEIMETIWEGQE
jgi:exonuclease SbcD